MRGSCTDVFSDILDDAGHWVEQQAPRSNDFNPVLLYHIVAPLNVHFYKVTNNME
jgi:hypothetical protein